MLSVIGTKAIASAEERFSSLDESMLKFCSNQWAIVDYITAKYRQDADIMICAMHIFNEAMNAQLERDLNATEINPVGTIQPDGAGCEVGSKSLLSGSLGEWRKRSRRNPRVDLPERSKGNSAGSNR